MAAVLSEGIRLQFHCAPEEGNYLQIEVRWK